LKGPGDNRYEVCISFSCLVQLYVGIMQEPDPGECKIQLLSMHGVLQILVTPNKCQHVMMERYFESPSSSRVCEPCRAKCTQCTKDLNLLTGRIYRSKLTQMLISFCLVQMQTMAALIKSIKTNKKDIFGGSIPARGMGLINALCL
jgi:hypothetical protein